MVAQEGNSGEAQATQEGIGAGFGDIARHFSYAEQSERVKELTAEIADLNHSNLLAASRQ